MEPLADSSRICYWGEVVASSRGYCCAGAEARGTAGASLLEASHAEASHDEASHDEASHHLVGPRIADEALVDMDEEQQGESRFAAAAGPNASGRLEP